ncbi:hypothetical protein EJ08DRAFT_598435, partial [Tothia fuscella]
CENCKHRKLRCNRVLPRCTRCELREVECVYPQRVKRKTFTLSSRSPHATPGIGSITSSIPNRHSTVGREGAEHIDLTAILNEALDEVQARRQRTFAIRYITEDVTISKEMARNWIDCYFTMMTTDIFLGLIDRKLIELVPDLLESSHVTLDPAVLVVYFGILYHGCSLSDESDYPFGKASSKYVEKLYIACLRSIPGWQREAKGTSTDLIAALFMSRVGLASFDYKLCFSVYKDACKNAQCLNLHMLDAKEDILLLKSATLQDYRKGVWELMHMDMFFHLLFNQPLRTSSSLEEWRVNLPQLDVKDVQAVPATAFLFNSRITFIIARFFRVVKEGSTDAAAQLAEIESLCTETEELFDEWEIDGWIRRSSITQLDCWLLADSAIMGYTCIIFMLRRMIDPLAVSSGPVTSDMDIRNSPHAYNAAHHIIGLINFLMEKFSTLETMSHLFGLYQCHIPFAYLASNVRSSSDVEMLEKVANNIAKVTKDEADFLPLSNGLRLSLQVSKNSLTGIT